MTMSTRPAPLDAGHFESGTGGVRIVLGRQRYRRKRRGDLAVWWREIDRVLVGIVLALMIAGVIAVAAGSAASADRLSTAAQTLPPLYFFWPHLAFLSMGVPIMLGVSMVPRDWARRGGIVLAAVMLLALLLVPVIGSEVNGARRWINIGVSFQPSEFYKPGFAILLAWIMSWKLRDPDMPVIFISGVVLAVSIALLMLQPDFGAAILLCGVWFVMAVIAGLPPRRIAWAAGGITALVVTAYFTYDNARTRIDDFLGGGEAYSQVDLARKTMLGGGWTGRGLWMGERKNSLPEAHTDYILSVIGEEFGLLAVAAIALAFCALVLRVLLRLTDEEDMFTILAATGIIVQLGGQAFINMAVNLQLFPSKGMTLPLISYGGSSMIALCLSLGLLLAITRRNPFLTRDGLRLLGGQSAGRGKARR